METKPFWEDQYARKDGLKTFHGGEPTEGVKLVLEKHLKTGYAVEFGCGAGRDSLYLAANGFRVTSLDISQTGIAKLNEIAAERSLNIDAYVKDMRHFEFTEQYDLFVAIGCLHLIPTDDQPDLLRKIMKFTKPGGFNVLGGFTNEVPTPMDMKPFFLGLFNKGQLFEIYKDWDILDKKEFKFTDDHGNGLSHTHAGHGLVARKP